LIGQDWSQLDDVEFVNSQRVWAYLLNGLGPPRMQVHSEACDFGGVDTFADPATDPAPWYDEVIPESADFAGFLVTSVTGGDDSPWQRNVYNNVSGGGVLGRLRAKPRSLVYSGVLLGRTCCAVAYGLSWLTSVLRGSGRCDPCVGSELGVSVCCPPTDTEGCLGTSLATPESVYRTLKGVGLVEGPTVVNRAGGSCGHCGCTETLEVQFTVVASVPWLWASPIVLWDQEPFPVPEGCVIEWIKVPPGAEGDALIASTCSQLGEVVCEDEVDCGADPFCSPAPTLPTLITAVDPCDCDPLDRAILCTFVPLAETFGRWFDGVPVVSVYSGSAVLRNVAVDVYEPEADVSGYTAEQLETYTSANPCQRLQRIRIGYVPADSVLTIDGTTRRITLSCQGAEPIPGDANLRGSFAWPELSCRDVIICVTADLLTVSPDATATVMVVPREAAPMPVAS